MTQMGTDRMEHRRSHAKAQRRKGPKASFLASLRLCVSLFQCCIEIAFSPFNYMTASEKAASNVSASPKPHRMRRWAERAGDATVVLLVLYLLVAYVVLPTLW